MKLLDGIMELRKLNASKEYFTSQTTVCCEAEVKMETERIKKGAEQYKAIVDKFEQLSNRIFEQMATHYVDVEGNRLSLLTLSTIISNEPFGVEETDTIDIFGGRYEIGNFSRSVSHPRLCYLNCMDNVIGNTCRSMPCGETILVDPFNLGETNGHLRDEYLAKARGIYIKALCEVDLP